MTSIYRRAMGPEFDRLHPEVQKRFGICSGDHLACIGRGLMHEMRHGRFMRPFLALGAKRRIMFPDGGSNVEFIVENYAYLDRFGRETYTWNRTFELATPRCFDETMIYSEKRGCIVCYCGSHQHLAVDLFLKAEPDGSLRIRSGGQRLYEWRLGIPFPTLLSGIGDIRISFDETNERFSIDVDVRNAMLGLIFGYHGSFTSEIRPCTPDSIPAEARPVREEPRE